MTDLTTVSLFCSSGVGQYHGLFGNVNPGWNHGFSRAKVEEFMEVQAKSGLPPTFHLSPVQCTRDADGFVWSNAANDFVDPNPPAKVAAPRAVAKPEPKKDDQQ